jgi:polysaccharide biosynthesis transport protein
MGVDSPGLGTYWGILVRNRYLILACGMAVAGGAAYYTSRQTPVFEASASLRMQVREPNLPDIYRSTGSAGSELATEIAVLRSRALQEDAASQLGLQVDVVEPRRVARGVLLDSISVTPHAPLAEYVLMRQPDGRFGVFTADSMRAVSLGLPGGRVHVPGATFVVKPAAAAYDQLRIGVSSLSDAVDRLSSVQVEQPQRDASILILSYNDTDSLIVREVPNLIASRYLARRQAIEKAEAGSAARFLREQLRRVSSELAAAEENFRSFREREQVLDPAVETSNEVSRLISKESERSSLDAERKALSKSLAEIDAAGREPGSPSPYRRLIGLPFLMRNEAASALLNALVNAEIEKSAKISVTALDPDMKILNAKIGDLEIQLRTIMTTYLQGLGNQVEALDATLGVYSRQLGSIPRKQLEYARLERGVKSLVTVHDLLQERLNEAEIAEAVTDASVRVVDSAVTPSGPSSPRPLMNVTAGLAVGLMLGIALACAKQVRDGSVHSRQDVLAATGVPVLGLIPRIPNARGRIALIADKRKLSSGGGSHAPARPPAGTVRRQPAQRSYTFLGIVDEPDLPQAQEPERAVRQAPLSAIELIVSRWTNVVAEAYSLLLTNVSFARSGPPPKAIVITSPLAEDGKTTCAVNLAVTLALRGTKTLLIDADLRRGVIHKGLGVDRAPGLSDMLSRSLSPQEAVRAMKVGGETGALHFLTTGSIPANPSALLESDRFRELLEHFRTQYDTVIIDSPPANIISDASVLGRLADAVLLVARSGVTESAALASAVDQLSRVGVTVAGVVLNDIDFKKESVYDPAYRSYEASRYLTAGSES